MKLYVKVENNLAVSYCIAEDNLQQLFPNKNIRDSEILSSIGYAPVKIKDCPITNSPSESWEQVFPTIDENGDFWQSYNLVTIDASDESISVAKEALVAIKKQLIKNHYDAKSKRPIVESGLGFNVDGGALDLSSFKSGKAQGQLKVKDADNTYQTLDSVDDYDLIISAIEAEQLRLINKKWELCDLFDSVDDSLDFNSYSEALDSITISSGSFNAT